MMIQDTLIDLYLLFTLSLATTAISVTISKAEVFASIRTWIAKHNSWLGKLVSCPYCTSHWVALALVIIYRPVLTLGWSNLDLIISMFSVVAIAAIFSGVIIRLNAYHGTEVEYENEVVLLRKTLNLARAKLAEQQKTIEELQKAN